MSALLRKILSLIWGLTLVALMFTSSYTPTISLVIGLALGSIVGNIWKKFTPLTSAITALASALTAIAVMFAFRSNALLWNAAYGLIAIAGILIRPHCSRALSISNLAINGGLGFCLGYIPGLLVDAYLVSPSMPFDAEALVCMPLILLGATAVPFAIFVLGGMVRRVTTAEV